MESFDENAQMHMKKIVQSFPFIQANEKVLMMMAFVVCLMMMLCY